jgi:hypothetical protein
MSANTEAARQYLTDRRNRLASEISALEGRRTEIEYLLAELDTPILRVVVPPPPMPPPSGIKRNKLKEKREMVHKALIAAGVAGLTCEEASVAAGVLRGTASSNLAQLKKSGLAVHKKPRYWAATKGYTEGINSLLDLVPPPLQV